MKSIVITGTDVELNNALQKAISNFSGELEIVYASPFTDDLIENLGFSQPDFIIADFLNEEQIKTILENVLKTTIVFISQDTNRTGAVISNFNKEGFFDFINLDKMQINPKDVLSQLANYSPSMFEEIDNETPISTEKVENPVTNEEKKLESASETIEEKNTSEVIEENKHDYIEQTNENTSENSPSTPNYQEVEQLTPKPVAELSKDIENKHNSEKLQNISQCQIITLYSKKGGTGNTTFVKEIANVFANATISKKISSKSSLDVCIVDFDFEQSNLRTMLGISNPNPNLYTLIDNILGKMEQGIPLSKIYYSEPEFKINYCIKLKNSPAYLLCLPQGDIPKRIVERIMAFSDENLFSKIIKKIIQILKNCFNIVVIDTTSSYNDINETLFKNSNKIVYLMEPTLADLENLKVTLDETRKTNYITNKLITAVNKGFKSRFNESFLNVYEEIQKENPDLKDIIGTASYDTQVVNYNNNYGFYSIIQSQFKSVIIAICHAILPIFKTRSLSDDISKLKRYQEMQKKKAQKEATKKATSNLNNSKKAKPSAKPPVPASTSKSDSNNATPTNTPNEVKKLDINNSASINSDEKKTVREYISSDLSHKDINSFVQDLKACSDVSLSKKGFPKITVQPKTLNKKVWKQYYKMLSKNI